MQGPTAAFFLAGLQILIGTFLFLWLSMILWPVIDRGHFRATTWVVAPLMLAIALGLPEGPRLATLAASAAAAAFLVAVYSQRPLLEHVGGVAASGLGIWALASAAASACPGWCAVEVAHALVGAVFLGAMTHGMVLGHWYLNQPRLPIEPLRGATRLMLGAVALSMAAGVATRGRLLAGEIVTSPFLISTSTYWWVWLAMMAGIGILGLMVRSTVSIKSNQSATGLLYLAMMPAMGAQFLVNLLVVT